MSRSTTPEYAAWRNAAMRCHNPRIADYANYGGRGIAMCAEWRKSFEAFLAHVGSRPSPLHSLDRIDVNGNYEPGNVRWATVSVQNANRRPRRLATECQRGHALDEANTYMHPSGKRQCRTCRREGLRSWRAKETNR